MRLFLDTSSLVKTYSYEKGYSEIILYLNNFKKLEIVLSKISVIEFTSALTRKLNRGELTKIEYDETIKIFDQNLNQFKFITPDENTLNLAKTKIAQYAEIGLRTLDSIQLASAISVRNEIEEVLSSDNKLNEIFLLENFKLKVF